MNGTNGELAMGKVEKTISSAIERFNKNYGEEIRAELAEVGKESAVVKFSGPVCGGPEAYDYFEDLRVEVESGSNRPFEILHIDKDGGNFLVKFDLKFQR